MVTTVEIASNPALAAFVRCYTYRQFDTFGLDIVKPWYASHELYLPFFFNDIPVKMITQNGRIITGKPFGSVGVVTGYMGEMTMNGNYSFISIQFNPNGFNKIFRLPSHEFTNDIIDGLDFMGSSVKNLYQQLLEAKNLPARTALLDKYLLSLLNRQRFVERKDAITCLSASIIKNAGLIDVRQLAGIANMSVRNFERRFNNEVGVAPKLFCRITRFNKALEAKLRNPHIEWTAIAQERGYYDQMHLIRDCKEFTGTNPNSFVKDTALLEKDFSHRLEV